MFAVAGTLKNKHQDKNAIVWTVQIEFCHVGDSDFCAQLFR